MPDGSSQRNRRPTMADVARLAGVSPKTVSRVVNGEPHVSADIKSRVEQAIADLNYRADRRARYLAARVRHNTVGFVQVDVANPWFGAVARGAEDVLDPLDMVLVSGSTDGDPAREAKLIHRFIENRVDGLILAGAAGDDDLIRAEVDAGLAVVCVDRVIDDVGCDVVIGQDRIRMAEATALLIENGHRRIGYLGGQPQIWTAQERRAGLEHAMVEAGVEVDPSLVMMGVDQPALAERAARALLDGERAPTALVTGQDRITIGVVAALHALGRQYVTALIGHDEIPFADQLAPSVSVVAQDPYQRGRIAAQLLVERMADPSIPPRTVTTPSHLIVRASAEIPPA